MAKVEASSNSLGYARVSTKDQDLEPQIAALVAAGVPRSSIFTDTISGMAKSRPGLEKAMRALRPGDVFHVYKLDRLGRSTLGNLQTAERIRAKGAELRSLTEEIDTSKMSGKIIFHVMSLIAEMERDLIAERTKLGLQNAKANGAKIGRPRAMTPEKMAKVDEMLVAGRPVTAIAVTVRVSRPVVAAYVKAKRDAEDV